MKLFFKLILVVILGISCKESQSSKAIPLEVKKYLVSNLKGSSLIDRDMLSENVLNYAEKKARVYLNEDFTGDGKTDYVCMLRDKDSLCYLVAFNNYKENISYHIIDGVADYGKTGIGNYLFSDDKKSGFYSHKLESSLSYIYWSNDTYKVDYNLD